MRAVRRLRRDRAGRDGVRVAAAVQQEVLVLHVREAFGIEGHADEVEVGIETMDLDRVLDVVLR